MMRRIAATPLRWLRRAAWTAGEIVSSFAFVVGVLACVAAVGEGAVSFVRSTDFDPQRRCAPRERSDCFSEVSGRVLPRPDEDEDDGTYDVAVTYDESPKPVRVTFLIGTDYSELGPGTRVRVQRWGKRVIALYSPRTERQYRTDAWPFRWHPDAVFVILFGGALASGGAVLFAIGKVRVVRRVLIPGQ